MGYVYVYQFSYYTNENDMLYSLNYIGGVVDKYLIEMLILNRF